MYCYYYCSFKFIVILIVAAIVHVIVGVQPKPCGSRTHCRASSWLSIYALFDPDAWMVVLANREVREIVIVSPYSGVNGRMPSGILHVCICMYVKPAVCMMYVFTRKNTYNTCRYIQIHTIHAIQTIHTYTCNTGITMQYIQYKHIHTIQ